MILKKKIITAFMPQNWCEFLTNRSLSWIFKTADTDQSYGEVQSTPLEDTSFFHTIFLTYQYLSLKNICIHSTRTER